MAIYSHIQPYTAIHGQIQPYTTIYNHILPYTAICSHIQRGFSLISQSPSRIHDFTWILPILCDFVADGRFYNYFSRFQPDLPEPLQNAWIYLDSCDIMRFCSQRFFLLTFPRFSLTSQNPSRIHDFTWIPIVLCDFVGTGCFYLLFQVSAWPNVKTRKNTYKVHNITVKSCKHQVKNHLKSK